MLCIYDRQHQVDENTVIHQEDQFENDYTQNEDKIKYLYAIEVFSPLIILAFFGLLHTIIGSIFKITNFQRESFQKNIFYRPRTFQNLWAYS